MLDCNVRWIYGDWSNDIYQKSNFLNAVFWVIKYFRYKGEPHHFSVSTISQSHSARYDSMKLLLFKRFDSNTVANTAWGKYAGRLSISNAHHLINRSTNKLKEKRESERVRELESEKEKKQKWSTLNGLDYVSGYVQLLLLLLLLLRTCVTCQQTSRFTGTFQRILHVFLLRTSIKLKLIQNSIKSWKFIETIL